MVLLTKSEMTIHSDRFCLALFHTRFQMLWSIYGVKTPVPPLIYSTDSLTSFINWMKKDEKYYSSRSEIIRERCNKILSV